MASLVIQGSTGVAIAIKDLLKPETSKYHNHIWIDTGASWASPVIVHNIDPDLADIIGELLTEQNVPVYLRDDSGKTIKKYYPVSKV